VGCQIGSCEFTRILHSDEAVARNRVRLGLDAAQRFRDIADLGDLSKS
jgi:hypothetical protein